MLGRLADPVSLQDAYPRSRIVRVEPARLGLVERNLFQAVLHNANSRHPTGIGSPNPHQLHLAGFNLSPRRELNKNQVRVPLYDHFPSSMFRSPAAFEDGWSPEASITTMMTARRSVPC